MKNLSKLAGLTAALFLLTGPAQAVTITDVVTFDNVLMCPEPGDNGCGPDGVSSVEWTFNINDSGFTRGSLISYTILLDVFDDFLPGGIDGDFTEPEFAMFFQAGEETMPVFPTFEQRSPFEIDLLPFLFEGTAAGFTALNGSGQLTVRLTAFFQALPNSPLNQNMFGDDFILRGATLTATIPEPGTLALFALGLAGIGVSTARGQKLQQI